MKGGTERVHDGLLRFAQLAARLKGVRRQGWLDRGIHDPESSADHSWSVALLGWLLAAEREDLNRERVLLLGLVHDLPEALAGDATPFDQHRNPDGSIPTDRLADLPEYERDQRAQKRAQEAAALEGMLRELPAVHASEIRDAWEEYERGESLEARFVRQIDKLETLIQAETYKQAQPEVIIESFRLGARRDITEPGLLKLVETLIDLGFKDREDE